MNREATTLSDDVEDDHVGVHGAQQIHQPKPVPHGQLVVSEEDEEQAQDERHRQRLQQV